MAKNFKQSQKRYMVSSSLSLISFIKVEFLVSLVVIGQRPASRVLEPGERALESAEGVSEPAERPLEPA